MLFPSLPLYLAALSLMQSIVTNLERHTQGEWSSEGGLANKLCEEAKEEEKLICVIWMGGWIIYYGRQWHQQ